MAYKWGGKCGISLIPPNIVTRVNKKKKNKRSRHRCRNCIRYRSLINYIRYNIQNRIPTSAIRHIKAAIENNG